jgi:hypothetical protein
MHRHTALAVPILVALGCGEPTEPPPPATAGAEEVPEAAAAPAERSAIEVLGGITPPEEPWETMDADEREFYMIGKVLPITKEIFQAFDGHAFEDFGCESCHGQDGEARDFAMPPPDLPPVPAPDTEAFAQMRHDQPRMVHFMSTRVTPTTATLLGFEPFDGETGEGFSCNGCHPTP